MTSRVSCFKMIKFNLKQKLWYGASLFLVFFFSMPFPLIIGWGLDPSSEFYDRELQDFTNQAVRILRGENMFICIIIVMAALIGAWTGLSYLHSRKKMDLYGSLPVTREQYFLVDTASMGLIFFIAYLGNILLTMTVAGARGGFHMNMGAEGITGLFTGFVFFLCIYMTAVTAMLLTGRVFTGILGTGVFLMAGPGCAWIVMSLQQLFSKTLMGDSQWVSGFLQYSSPVTAYMSMTDVLRGNELMYNGMQQGQRSIVWPEYWKIIAGILVLTFILTMLNIWLIRKRPAEGAGSSMVFSKTEGPVKFVVLTILTLAGGIFFETLGQITGNEKIWLFLGMGIFWIIGGIIIEIIYYQDRKKIFGHKIWSSGALAAAMAVVFLAMAGMHAYDRWIPDPEDVEAAFAQPGGYKYVDYSCDDPDDPAHPEFLEKHLEQYHDPQTFEIAKKAIEKFDDQEEHCRTVEITYKMSDGSVKKRMYPVDKALYNTLNEQLLSDPSTRVLSYPILKYDPDLYTMELYDEMTGYSLLDTLSEQEKKELKIVYLEELRNMESKDLEYYNFLESGETNTDRFLSMEFYPDGRNDYSYQTFYAPLHKKFVKTLKFMEDHGIEIQL